MKLSYLLTGFPFAIKPINRAGAHMKVISFQIFGRLHKVLVGVVAFAWSLSVALSAHALDLAQTPLFVGQNAKPTIMLAMSRDQELFFSAYPDYSNLDGKDLTSADTTYRNDFDYAGYFDAKWCYSYTAATPVKGSTFNPVSKAIDHKCSHDAANNAKTGTDRWSGNFLNWASMTRLDIVRKVLYGGTRYVDTATQTVLSRTYIPKESHAFVKVYKSAGANSVSNFTPYTNSEISMCNVSTESDATNGYPLIRIASGSWPQWSHTEEQQCQWQGSTSLPVSNLGSSSSPNQGTNKIAELVPRINVCVSAKDADTNTYVDSDDTTSDNRCRAYQGGSYKPIGLLQKFYKSVNFGLVSGTWAKNASGGVLRKKASQLAGNAFTTTDTVNEFNADTGIFNSANVTTGIIKTIDAWRIQGYSYSTTDMVRSYNGTSDWGNPIGEIYAEALRYINGKGSPTSAFNGNDSWLTKESSWGTDPVPASSWCSKCSIVVISSGPNTYDGGDGTSISLSGSSTGDFSDSFLATVGSLTHSTLSNNYTDVIGLREFGTGSTNANVFYGGTNPASQCAATSKKMSTMLGKCPESPIGEGTYDIAGLAYWAHIIDQRSGYTGTQTINTYAVELSEGLPNFQIPVGDKIASFVPVCSANSKTTACTLVGTRVESLVTDTTGKLISGSYLFYWEDNKMWDGSAYDYDMDAVQRVSFCVGSACSPAVGSKEMRITNTLPYWATGAGNMYMSYILDGVKESTSAPVIKNGLQTAQYVNRTGYEFVPQFNTPTVPATFKTTMNSNTWYNTILPQGTDPLPNNTTTATYKTSGVFEVVGSTVTAVKTPLYYAAKWGSFSKADTTSNKDNFPNLDSEWDNKKLDGTDGADGIPDNYFMMKNPSLLEKRLYDIFKDATSDISSGTGVSTNSTQLNDSTRIYQARFYTDGWYGELRALDKTLNQEWSTLEKLTGSSGRKIFSTSNNTGIVFPTIPNATVFGATFTAAQQTALGGTTEGPKVVNWVRGDEVTGKRIRRKTATSPLHLIGDIVNSTPVFFGATDQGYKNLDSAYGSTSYLAYVNAKKSQKTVIYVGANDGMLHAIDASNGDELFAYVPSMVYSKLPTIAASTYGASVPHTYTVDGPITIGDAYINGAWKTILVGTLGAGGRGIFVLDITNPGTFSAANVLFEITPDDVGYSAIGNVMGKPLIAPVSGRWKIVFGNGYNGTPSNAGLFVIDIQYPKNSAYSKFIQAGTATENGLARPVALQDASTGAIKSVYAGDLLGNMWKFDLSGTVSNWKLSLSNKPLFIAVDPSNNPQPIFSSPTLGTNTNLPTATMVYFGTGKYLEANDVATEQMGRIQSFYGLADEGNSIAYVSARTEKLHQKTMTATATTRNVNDSGTSAVPVSWTTKKGWFLDFPAGERILSKPLLLYDRLIFATVVPTSDSCSYGGSGWFMELVGVGDVYGTEKELLPNNGKLDEFFLPGDLIKLKGDTTVVIKSDITGKIDDVALDDPKEVVSGLGRVSWRQLK